MASSSRTRDLNSPDSGSSLRARELECACPPEAAAWEGDGAAAFACSFDRSLQWKECRSDHMQRMRIYEKGWETTHTLRD